VAYVVEVFWSVSRRSRDSVQRALPRNPTCPTCPTWWKSFDLSREDRETACSKLFPKILRARRALRGGSLWSVARRSEGSVQRALPPNPTCPTCSTWC